MTRMTSVSAVIALSLMSNPVIGFERQPGMKKPVIETGLEQLIIDNELRLTLCKEEKGDPRIGEKIILYARRKGVSVQVASEVIGEKTADLGFWLILNQKVERYCRKLKKRMPP